MPNQLVPQPITRTALVLCTATLLLMYALCVVMWLARVENSGETTYFFVAGNLTLA